MRRILEVKFDYNSWGDLCKMSFKLVVSSISSAGVSQHNAEIDPSIKMLSGI